MQNKIKYRNLKLIWPMTHTVYVIVLPPRITGLLVLCTNQARYLVQYTSRVSVTAPQP